MTKLQSVLLVGSYVFVSGTVLATLLAMPLYAILFDDASWWWFVSCVAAFLLVPRPSGWRLMLPSVRDLERRIEHAYPVNAHTY